MQFLICRTYTWIPNEISHPWFSWKFLISFNLNWCDITDLGPSNSPIPRETLGPFHSRILKPRLQRRGYLMITVRSLIESFTFYSYTSRNCFQISPIREETWRKPKIQPDWNNVKSSRRVQRSVRCTWTLFTVLVTNQAIYRLAIIVSNFLGTLSWFNFMRSRRFVSFPCWKYNSEMLLEDISLFNCLNGYILVFQPYLQDIHVVVYSFSGLQFRISLNFNSVGEI